MEGRKKQLPKRAVEHEVNKIQRILYERYRVEYTKRMIVSNPNEIWVLTEIRSRLKEGTLHQISPAMRLLFHQYWEEEYQRALLEDSPAYDYTAVCPTCGVEVEVSFQWETKDFIVDFHKRLNGHPCRGEGSILTSAERQE